MLKHYYTWLCLFIINLGFAQEKPFTIRYQGYLNGDMTFIANSIVGKKSGKTANEPYNKTSSSAKLNDQVDMVYIDIDQDESTFSSSSAFLQYLEPEDKVVFAGLYWSATLPQKERKAELPIEQILLKTPSYDNYFTVNGEIIFDTKNLNKHQVNAPYVCFADVTQWVKNKPTGEYIVANIQASQQKIEGGSAGGWSLIIVYESTQTSSHYISLYDGFSFIYDKPITLTFENFKTPKEGKITPKLFMGALEGDLNIEGDNVRINTPNSTKWSYVSAKTRNGQNIFNSKITQNNTEFIQRNPASLNTLGYDVFLENLNSKEQSFANIEQVNLKISSIGDKFYVTNVGFSIEVDEAFAKTKIKTTPSENLAINEPKTPEISVIDNTIETSKPKTASQSIPNPIRPKKDIKTYIFENHNHKTGYYLIANVYQNPLYAENFITELKAKNIPAQSFLNPLNKLTYVFISSNQSEEAIDKKYNTIKYDGELWIAKIVNNKNLVEKKFEKETRTPKEISKLILPKSSNIKKGYYLVANVFEIPSNAKNYISFLKSKNINSGFFINPKNNYHYIFLAHYTTLEDAEKAYNSNFNNRFFDEYWIKEVVLE